MFYHLTLPIFKSLDVAFTHSGNFHHTQWLRFHADKYFFRHYGRFSIREELEESLFSIWSYDLTLRAILQQQEHTISQRNVLLGQKRSSQREINSLTEFLRRLSLSFAEYTNRHSAAIAVLPDGPIKRSYLSLRRKPTWYLNRGLTRECVRQNGCCARGCGCCETRSQQYKDEGLGIGHCSPECACCKKARGISFRTEEERTSFWKTWAKAFEEEPFKRNIHWLKIRQAFFFGID